MSDAVATDLRVGVARETEAVDLARFVQELGLTATCNGTTVEIREAPADISQAVTAWLAEWHAALVPAGWSEKIMLLRQPSD